MRASLSVLYFGLLLPVSVLGGPATSPSDANVARRDPLPVKPLAVGNVVGALTARSLEDAEPLAQLKARDDDDDDDDNNDDDDDNDNDNDNDNDDDDDGVFDDIKDGVDNVGDDIKDSVDDVFDDGVANLKPGMVTVGLLAMAVALGVM